MRSSHNDPSENCPLAAVPTTTLVAPPWCLTTLALSSPATMAVGASPPPNLALRCTGTRVFGMWIPRTTLGWARCGCDRAAAFAHSPSCCAKLRDEVPSPHYSRYNGFVLFYTLFIMVHGAFLSSAADTACFLLFGLQRVFHARSFCSREQTPLREI